MTIGRFSSCPVSVTRTMISHCADGSPSEKQPDELTQKELKEFARFGNAVASLCVEKKGAIPAMPELAQVERRIAEESYS